MTSRVQIPKPSFDGHARAEMLLSGENQRQEPLHPGRCDGRGLDLEAAVALRTAPRRRSLTMRDLLVAAGEGNAERLFGWLRAGAACSWLGSESCRAGAMVCVCVVWRRWAAAMEEQSFLRKVSYELNKPISPFAVMALTKSNGPLTRVSRRFSQTHHHKRIEFHRQALLTVIIITPFELCHWLRTIVELTSRAELHSGIPHLHAHGVFI